MFAMAFRHHQAGRLAEAEALYRQIVAASPAHAEVWHLLGVIASQTGRQEGAVALIRLAIDLLPNDSAFHYNLGFALRELGRLEESATAYHRATQLKPDYAMAHNNLGSVLQELGRSDAALAEFREAVRLEPECAVAHNNIGNVLREQDRLDEAVAAYCQAIRYQPGYAEAHSNLGVAHGAQRRWDAALLEHQQALRFQPDSAENNFNLGVALSALHRADEAAEAFRRGLSLNRDYAEGHYNLGLAMAEMGRLDDAVVAYGQALRLKPGLVEAWNNLGTALKELGEVDAAIRAYRQAIEIRPDFPMAHSNLLLALHYRPEIDDESLFQEHCRWDEQHARPLAIGAPPHANDRHPERRLRVGYVSADFRAHSVAYFVECLLANHDRSQAEVFCYANVAAPDAVTARLRGIVSQWREIAGTTAEAVAKMIRDDAIDILVDLGGHTANHRLLVFARKPAPVQVTYLGYGDTTGMEAMNYRFTDAEADPVGSSEERHTEQLVRLPGGAWCFRPPDDAPEVAECPAIQNGYVTFGCFNALAKINEPMIRLWSQILTQVTGSRLLLKNAGLQNASSRERIHTMFERAAIARDRVDFVGRSLGATVHLESYGRVDIALDTFPYHGATTTCEALWMGVPVVTLAGTAHISRVSASLLTHLGMPEWIGDSPERYANIASDLVRNVSALAEIRKNLRSRMKASPLMDGPRLARAVEQAYREMWRAWCERQG
jgi:predicted O-linked N-acetylglucosamine transferase (SPINDLY family)